MRTAACETTGGSGGDGGVQRRAQRVGPLKFPNRDAHFRRDDEVSWGMRLERRQLRAERRWEGSALSCCKVDM
jgi:hypothetical protein